MSSRRADVVYLVSLPWFVTYRKKRRESSRRSCTNSNHVYTTNSVHFEFKQIKKIYYLQKLHAEVKLFVISGNTERNLKKLAQHFQVLRNRNQFPSSPFPLLAGSFPAFFAVCTNICMSFCRKWKNRLRKIESVRTARFSIPRAQAVEMHQISQGWCVVLPEG